jgi:DNA-binding MarR family transcriptional regulator
MSPDEIQLTDRTGFLAQKVGTLFLQAVADRLARIGLSNRQYFVLAGVETAGPVSQQDLARLLSIDPTVMVGLVDELERSGFVSRTRDPADRRRYALALTAGGKKAVARAHAAMTAVEQDFFSPLTDTQRDRYRDALKRLLAGRWP